MKAVTRGVHNLSRGREFAAWLGIVPQQYSTGGKTNLLSISKRDTLNLRKILIHDARAAIMRIKGDRAPIGAWLDRLDAQAPQIVGQVFEVRISPPSLCFDDL